MDEFSCCNLDDALMIAETLEEKGTVVFSFSIDRVSAYVVLLSNDFEKIGVMPFGGNPIGNVCVAVLYHGMYWFDPGHETNVNYLRSKLDLRDADAENITLMVNEVFKEMRK